MANQQWGTPEHTKVVAMGNLLLNFCLQITDENITIPEQFSKMSNRVNKVLSSRMKWLNIGQKAEAGIVYQ